MREPRRAPTIRSASPGRPNEVRCAIELFYNGCIFYVCLPSILNFVEINDEELVCTLPNLVCTNRTALPASWTRHTSSQRFRGLRCGKIGRGLSSVPRGSPIASLMVHECFIQTATENRCFVATLDVGGTRPQAQNKWRADYK